MANKNKSDMAAFKKWLVDTKMVSKASATVYASRVRKVLSRMDVLSREEIDRVMTELLNDSFHSHMSCWNHFSEYCLTKDIRLPNPTVTKASKKKQRDPELPELVTLALINIMEKCKLKTQELVGFRWEHVEMRGDADWWIHDPYTSGLMYFAPSDAMRIICDWANGEIEIEKERPLIPRVALSMVPMSKSVIKRSISGRRRNRLL